MRTKISSIQKLNNYSPKTEYPRQKLNISLIGILESSHIENLNFILNIVVYIFKIKNIFGQITATK
jgi:hypothetical protein